MKLSASMRSLLISFCLIFLIFATACRANQTELNQSESLISPDQHDGDALLSLNNGLANSASQSPAQVKSLRKSALRIEVTALDQKRALTREGDTETWDVRFGPGRHIFWNKQFVEVIRYVGGLKGAVASGKGTLVFGKDRKIYIGEFADGYAQGVGAILSEKHDLSILAEFKNNNLHGLGITFSQGRVPKRKAYYVDGDLENGKNFEYNRGSASYFSESVLLRAIKNEEKQAQVFHIPKLIRERNGDLLILYKNKAAYLWKSTGKVLSGFFQRDEALNEIGFSRECELNTGLATIRGRCSTANNQYPLQGKIKYIRQKDGEVFSGKVSEGNVTLENGDRIKIGKVELTSFSDTEMSQPRSTNKASKKYLCEIANTVERAVGCRIRPLGLDISVDSHQKLVVTTVSGQPVPFSVVGFDAESLRDDVFASWITYIKADSFVRRFENVAPYNPGNWRLGVRYDLSLPYFSHNHIGRPTQTGQLRRGLLGKSHYGAQRCIEEIEGFCINSEIHIGTDYDVPTGGIVLSPVTGKILPSLRNQDGSDSIKIESKDVVIQIRNASLLPTYKPGMQVKKGDPVAVASDSSNLFPGMSNHIHMRILDKKESFTFSLDGKSMVLPEDASL